MYTYTLVWKGTQAILFKSQFLFLTEGSCLRHYEKGIAKNLFSLDRVTINHIWSGLGLWGLIGRVCPVELVRILCAFGCGIEVSADADLAKTLMRSFRRVSYFVPLFSGEEQFIRHVYHKPIDSNAMEHIPLLLKLDDRLVLGSYYTTVGRDADVQLPAFCRFLEKDLCLPSGTMREVLSVLFWEGYIFMAQDEHHGEILAEYEPAQDLIRGYMGEETLFYVGGASSLARRKAS